MRQIKTLLSISKYSSSKLYIETILKYKIEGKTQIPNPTLKLNIDTK